MIFLECREDRSSRLLDENSPTFRTDVIEARHPWGVQDESCLTLNGVSLGDKRCVYICGDKLNTYHSGEPVRLILEPYKAPLPTTIPVNESVFSVAVCGSFMDSFNCYLIDGDHYEAISCSKFTNFISSCLDNLRLEGAVSSNPALPISIHLLMPYAAHITMRSLPPLCQNHYYDKILTEPHVLDGGIFSTFAYRFCNELRVLKPALRFHVYAPVGDFKHQPGGQLQWETETGFLFRANRLSNNISLASFETSNFSDYPSHYDMEQGALIHYDFSDLGPIYINGDKSKDPLYHGDVKPPYSEDLSSVEPPSERPSWGDKLPPEGPRQREAQDSHHDRYLRME